MQLGMAKGERNPTARGQGKGFGETPNGAPEMGALPKVRVSPESAGLKSGVWFAPGFGHAEVSGDTRM